MVLTNGHGQTYKAKINSAGSLYTISTALGLAHTEAHTNGNVFNITHEVVAPNTNMNTIFYFQNKITESGYNVVVSDINLFCDNNAKWQVFTEPTYLSGGSDLTPVNVNRTKSETLKSITKASSTGNFLALTGQSYYLALGMNQAYDTAHFNDKDIFHLGYDDTLGINCQTALSGTIYISMTLTKHSHT